MSLRSKLHESIGVVGTYHADHDLSKRFVRFLSQLISHRLDLQTMHWQVEGPTFYQDHLLYKQMYEELDPFVDEYAEIIIGQFGRDALHPKSMYFGLAELCEIKARKMNHDVGATELAEIMLDLTIDLEIVAEGLIGDMKRERHDVSEGLRDTTAKICNTINRHQYLLSSRVGKRSTRRQ